MKFTALNIDSKKPYYIDQFGRFYNNKFTEVLGWDERGSRIFSYHTKDGKVKRSTFSRLVYKNHFPEEDISEYNIFLIDKNAEHPHCIDNLKKVLKTNMVYENKLPLFEKGNIPPKRKFFWELLPKVDFDKLVNLSHDKSISNVFIAKTFGVNADTITKVRKMLQN